MKKIKTLVAMILLVAVTLFLSTIGRAQTDPTSRSVKMEDISGVVLTSDY